jgi:hypothetical protein
MTPKDLLTQLDQDLELEAKATPGLWWGIDDPEWFICAENNGNPKQVAQHLSEEDLDFVVRARNTFRSRTEALTVAIKALRCENTKALCESEPKNRNCKFVYGKALCFNCIAVEKITKLLREVKGGLQ